MELALDHRMIIDDPISDLSNELKEDLLRIQKYLCLIPFLLLGCTHASVNEPQRRAAAVDTSKPLLEQAVDIVSDLNRLTEERYGTTGFSNREQFLAAVEKAGPAAIQAKNLLEKEDFEIATAIPEAYREGVMKRGIINFRESGTSEGGTTRDRDECEASYSNMTVEEYKKLNFSLMSKSAYLSPKFPSKLKASQTIAAYGGDHYIYKMENIRNRITWTPGDSLNRRFTYRYAEPIKPTPWDQTYVAWNHRELAIPFLTTGLAENPPKLGIHMVLEFKSAKEMGDDAKFYIQLTDSENSNVKVLWTPISPPALVFPESLKSFNVPWDYKMDYIEVQVWGPVLFDDIAAFEFTKTPPQGAFLNALKAKGIQIRDGRKFPPVLWTGK